MDLVGLHHITMITGDAQENVASMPTRSACGSSRRPSTSTSRRPTTCTSATRPARRLDPHVVRVPWRRARPRRRGDDPHAATRRALAGGAGLLGGAGRRRARRGHAALPGHDGLQLELVVSSLGNPPLVASHPDVAAEYAITGLEGARAFSAYANVEERVLTGTLGFTYRGDGEYVLEGAERSFRWAYDPAPAVRGGQGAAASTTSRGRHATRTTSRGRRGSPRPAGT